MDTIKVAYRACYTICLLILAGCSSGGGGGTSPVTTAPVAPAPAPITPPASLGPAQQAYLGGIPLPQADASTTAFVNGGPPVNTTFPLVESVLQTDERKLTGIQLTDGATLTRTGTATYSGRPTPVYDLKIPGLGVVATGIFTDGTLWPVSDARKASVILTGLNYSMLGTWMVSGSGPTFQQAIFVTGYQSAAKDLPIAGTATYVDNSPVGAGAGRTTGLIFTSGSGIRTGTLEGSATMTLDFSSNMVNGSLNLSATDGSSTTPWNTVNLRGSLTGVNVVGTTSTSDTPTGPLAFGAGSTGNFNGSLFGPHAEEAGVVWTLHDPSGIGKTAVGAFLATKQ